MNINIVDSEFAKCEEEMLKAALTVVMRHQRVKLATIICSPRSLNGWIEWGVRLDYEPEGGMFIGVIQRREGAKIETHS